MITNLDQHRFGRPALVSLLLLIGVALGGCGSDDGASAVEAETDSGTAAEVDEAVDGADAGQDSGAGDEAGDDGEVTVEWVDAESHLFGGMTFQYPADHLLGQSRRDNFISVHLPGSAGFNGPTSAVVLMTRVSQAFNGQPITSIEDVVSTAEVVAGGEATELTETLDFLGEELVGYQFQKVDDRPLFSGVDLGFPGESWWAPSNHSIVYMAELDDSVMAVMALSRSKQGLEGMDTLLRDIVATATLTAEGGEIAPLPTPDVPVPIDFGPPPEIAPAEPIDNEAAVLTGPSFEPPNGLVQFTTLGFPLEISLPGEVILPRNQPGFIGIADINSRGPYILDWRAAVAVRGLVPMGAGEVPIGEPLDLNSIEEILADPPANLSFTNVETTIDVGGQPGVRFDVSIVDSETCGGIESPCNYAFMGPLDEYHLVNGFDHVSRVWLVPDVPEGPLLIMAAGPGDEVGPWLEKVDTMMSSMVITVS